MVIEGVCLEMVVTPVTKHASVGKTRNMVGYLTRSNNRRMFFGNPVVRFPDKDLSNDKHHLPVCDAVRLLPRQKHEKQFFKTDSRCTGHSSGFGATCAT
jgi:hypothetical protein